MSETIAGRPGQPVDLGGGVACLLAPNPSPMTYRGTNTYLVRDPNDPGAPAAVIDPGPLDRAHLAAIRAAAPGGIAHVLVTHAHLDHSPLARPLAEASGAPVLAFGDAGSGRLPVMDRLAQRGMLGGGEGVDRDFRPDRRLADGEAVEGPGYRLTALWTPGHMGNHLSFALGDRIFSGDLVMGWASSLVSPPDGDLGRFMESCRRLAALAPRTLLPGHGDPVTDPAARIAWLLAHRESRSAEIRAQLTRGPADAATLTARLYATTPPELHPAARRNVVAHLVDMHEKNEVVADPSLHADAIFSLR